jgi:two-component system, OmpR family, KDP operon response regulator KdpE
MSMHALVAEDSHDVAETIAFAIRMAWPDSIVTIATSGAEALDIFERDELDVVTLDVSLPPPDGFTVCRRIREHSEVPILMLTVRDDTLDKVRALDLGADDYLTKPFDHLELLARLRAIIRRRGGPSTASAPLTVGNVSIDTALHEVTVAGELVALTSTEFRLLEELVRHAGRVLPHQYLLERVWGPEYVGDEGYLKVFVRRLRQKLGDDAAHPRYIQTEWGIGYRFLASQ